MASLSADAVRVNYLGTLKLPTLPAGTPFLLKSLADENIDFVELAEVLEKFPSIAGKLISLANSVWSAPATEISSLEAACSRLGFGVVRSTSIALAVSAPFDAARCESFDPEYFWCSSLLGADAASRIAQSATAGDDAPEPATARAAGLLHNLGLLWLVDSLPGAVDGAYALAESRRATHLRQALVRVIGFDQAEAGGYLAGAWSLPQPLVQAMRHYHDADYRGAQSRIVQTVGLAVELVAAILEEEPCPAADSRVAALGIDGGMLENLYAQLGAQLVKTRAIARALV